MDVTFDGLAVGSAEVKVVIIDETVGNGDDGDVSGEAAVVPPIGLQRGDAVGDAGIVDGDDGEVTAGMEDAGDLAVEGREAAFVVADVLAVDEEVGAIVGGPDVEEGARAGFRSVVEVVLIPEHALVVVEGFLLRVPIARNLEGWGFRE